MNKGVTRFVVALASFVSACASSSGVIEIADNTYTITTSASPGRGGAPAAKRMAYQEASEVCEKRGLKLLMLNEQIESPTWTDGMAKASINFKCQGN